MKYVHMVYVIWDLQLIHMGGFTVHVMRPLLVALHVNKWVNGCDV